MRVGTLFSLRTVDILSPASEAGRDENVEVTLKIMHHEVAAQHHILGWVYLN